MDNIIFDFTKSFYELIMWPLDQGMPIGIFIMYWLFFIFIYFMWMNSRHWKYRKEGLK